MDFFKDLDDIRHSFREFAHKLPDYGYLIINGEIENINYIVDGLEAEYATFGLENDSYDYCAKTSGTMHLDMLISIITIKENLLTISS